MDTTNGTPMTEKLDSFAAKLAYLASSTLTLGGAMSLQEAAIIVGIIFTILTYLTNLYFKRKHLQLAKEQAEKPRPRENK